jgi:hypothetical protein
LEASHMTFLASLVLSRQEYKQTLLDSFPTVIVRRVFIHNLAANLRKMHTTNLEDKNLSDLSFCHFSQF